MPMSIYYFYKQFYFHEQFYLYNFISTIGSTAILSSCCSVLDHVFQLFCTVSKIGIYGLLSILTFTL